MSSREMILAAALVAIAPAAYAQLFTEHFNYPDGDLTVGSGGSWVTIGEDATPLNVSLGAAIINQGNTTLGRADVGRALGTTLSQGAGSTVFAGFDATWSTLPSNNNGSYFAVFSTAPSASTFYGRIGADRQGAAEGKFRISVANANWTQANSVEFPQDLSLHVTYHVVVRYDLANGQTTLWVDPANASSPSVTATDAVATQSDITAFALREGISSGTGAPGVIALDDLVLATSFAQLTPVPEPAAYGAFCGLALAGWALLRRRQRTSR